MLIKPRKRVRRLVRSEKAEQKEFVNVAGLGGHYTRSSSQSPEEYYGLIDPETDAIQPYIERYMEDMMAEREYDNE